MISWEAGHILLKVSIYSRPSYLLTLFPSVKITNSHCLLHLHKSPTTGTAVLMPQRAPYGDPLQVMICGGSIPGPEIALDNCVSLQPEVAGANWTIERMVSCCT